MKRIGVMVLAVAALLAGCGGGGGVADVPTPTLEIATRAPLATTVLYAVQLTVRLPAGVTVAADASGEVASNVLTPAIAGSSVNAKYLPAGTGTPATVTIGVVNANGFTVGNLASVACRVGQGLTVTAASFSVIDFLAWDQNGARIAVDGIGTELSYALL